MRFVGLTVESDGSRCARRRDLRDLIARGAARRHARGSRGLLRAARAADALRRSARHRDRQRSHRHRPQRATSPPDEQLLGRVIDGFGQPLDGAPLAAPALRYPLYPPPLNPLQRGMVREVLETGIRAIDTLLTLGRGQRVGIFAGSGVGKSTVLGMLAREVKADVSVIALIGERGREVRAFVEEGLSSEARKRSVVVAATSDQPPLVRRRAAFLATADRRTFPRRGPARVPDHGLDHARRDGAARDRPRARRVADGARLHAVGVHAAAAAARTRRRAQRGRLDHRAVHRAGRRRRRERADLRYGALDPRRPHRAVARHRASRPVSRPSTSRAASAGCASIADHERERAADGRGRQAHGDLRSRRAISSRSAPTAPAPTPSVDRAIQLIPALEQFLAQRPDETERARGRHAAAAHGCISGVQPERCGKTRARCAAELEASSDCAGRGARVCAGSARRACAVAGERARAAPRAGARRHASGACSGSTVVAAARARARRGAPSEFTALQRRDRRGGGRQCARSSQREPASRSRAQRTSSAARSKSCPWSSA